MLRQTGVKHHPSQQSKVFTSIAECMPTLTLPLVTVSQN